MWLKMWKTGTKKEILKCQLAVNVKELQWSTYWPTYVNWFCIVVMLLLFWFIVISTYNCFKAVPMKNFCSGCQHIYPWEHIVWCLVVHQSILHKQCGVSISLKMSPIQLSSKSIFHNIHTQHCIGILCVHAEKLLLLWLVRGVHYTSDILSPASRLYLEAKQMSTRKTCLCMAHSCLAYSLLSLAVRCMHKGLCLLAEQVVGGS